MNAATDPLLVLHHHNHWSTRKVLTQCSVLSREQFHRRMPIGHGSLHNNLTHIVGAMRRWNDRIAGGVLRPSIELPPEAKERTPGRLIELLDEAHAELSATLHAASPDLSRRILFTYPAPDGDRTINLTAGAAFSHLYTHGQHHRTQCLNMLRQLGYPTDSGDFDVIEWSDAAAKPGA